MVSLQKVLKGTILTIIKLENQQKIVVGIHTWKLLQSATARTLQNPWHNIILIWLLLPLPTKNLQIMIIKCGA